MSATKQKTTSDQPKTGLKGKGVDKIITQFFGKLENWDVVPTTTSNLSRQNVLDIATHMNETGDCLWHAQCTVLNNLKNCYCVVCRPDVKKLKI